MPHNTRCSQRPFVSAEWPASVSVTAASVCSLLVDKDHDSCCLQAPSAAKRDQQFRQEPDSAEVEAPPVLTHHASFPETAAELVLDLTVEGHNAGTTHSTKNPPIDRLIV